MIQLYYLLNPPPGINQKKTVQNGYYKINFLKKLLQKFYENEEGKINNFAMNIEICYTDI